MLDYFDNLVKKFFFSQLLILKLDLTIDITTTIIIIEYALLILIILNKFVCSNTFVKIAIQKKSIFSIWEVSWILL